MISISDVLSFMRWNGFPCLWSKQSLAGVSISFASQSEPCFSYFEFASQNFTLKNPPLIHVRLKFWIGFLYRWSNFFQDKDQNFYRSEKLSKIYKILLKDCLVISSIFEILEEFFVMRISSESEEVEIHSVGIFSFFFHSAENSFFYFSLSKTDQVTWYVKHAIRLQKLPFDPISFWSNSVKRWSRKCIKRRFICIKYYQHKNKNLFQILWWIKTTVPMILILSRVNWSVSESMSSSQSLRSAWRPLALGLRWNKN